MTLLVSYSSSEEDSNEAQNQPSDTKGQNLSLQEVQRCASQEDILNKQISKPDKNSASDHPKLCAPIMGPSPFPDNEVDCNLPEDPIFSTMSPYSKNRAMLRNLTIPSLPNYNIPRSPIGSSRVDTEAKFTNFLELKRQGIHFNHKLIKSTTLKNPSLTQRLMDFAKMDIIDQYSTTLPKSHWDPSAFPSYAYHEELSKSQAKILKKKDDEKAKGRREKIDFTSGASSTEVGVFGVMPKPIHKPCCKQD